jgi:glycosyltransferase involved in cell wall biosynthesis
MPRVLVLCEYASLNGGERSLLAVLDGVQRAGFELSVAAPPAGPLADAIRCRGVRLVPLGLHRPSGSRLELSACRRRVREAITGSGADLVHANSLSTSRISGPVVAQLGIPSLGHLRDILRVSPAVVADLNRHTRLLAVSQATRDWYLTAGLRPEKTRVLFNGVDLQEYRPGPPSGFLVRELGLSSTSRLVGSIGQIGMRKGLHTFARAAERIVHDGHDVHFVVVGQRYSQKPEAIQYEHQLLDMTSKQPLRGRFHLLGVRDDVPQLLREFHVLAHAARQEPLGRVLLEAAACAVPVVATDVGGTREIFPDDAGAAILIPADDAQSLADAVTRLLRDDELRQRVGRAARCRAEQAFDAGQAAELLAEHYRAVLA